MLEKLRFDWTVLVGALKYSAVIGAIIYIVLFVSYWSYYSHLGIRPEDAGVNHPFILARSFGLISLVFGTCVALSIFAFPFFLSGRMFRTNSVYLIFPALTLAFTFAYACLLIEQKYLQLMLPEVSESAAAYASIALVIPSALLVLWKTIRTPNNLLLYAGVATTIVMAIGLPIGATVARAHQLGKEAADGKDIRSFAVFGIPILDVSSDPAELSWVCRPDQRPVTLDPKIRPALLGHLVGSNSSNVLFMGLDHKIVSLPQECVMVTRPLTG